MSKAEHESSHEEIPVNQASILEEISEHLKKMSMDISELNKEVAAIRRVVIGEDYVRRDMT